MIDDSELLRRYASERSESAFTELAKRHLPLVFNAAHRRLSGDAHEAANVSQLVFCKLADNATRLAQYATLAAWLYTTTRHACIDSIRREQRRCKREKTFEIMSEPGTNPPEQVAWSQLKPLLDSALDDLNEKDRESVIWRFLEGMKFGEIARLRGSSEDAARMQTSRSLERLRNALAKRGITSTSSAIAALITSEATSAAPAGLLNSVVGGVTAQAAAGITTAASLALKFTGTTKLLSGLIAAGIGLALVSSLNEARRLNASRLELNAAERKHVQLLANLAEMNGKIADTSEEAKKLKAELDKPRPTSGPRPLPRPGNVGLDSRSPISLEAGRAFFAAHPDLKRLYADERKREVFSQYFQFYRVAGLTEAQIEAFEALMINGRTSTFSSKEMGNVTLTLDPGDGLEKDQVDEGVHRLLGEENYEKFKKINNSDPADALSRTFASSLYFTDTPLSPKQGDQLIEMIRQTSFGRNQTLPGDWERLRKQAAPILSPEQLESWAELITIEQFHQAAALAAGHADMVWY